MIQMSYQDFFFSYCPYTKRIRNAQIWNKTDEYLLLLSVVS